MDAAHRNCFVDRVRFLRNYKLFGQEDVLFPKTKAGYVPGQALCDLGLAREGHANASPLNAIIRGAFVAVQLPQFTAHVCRKTLTKYGYEISTTSHARRRR